MSSVKQQLNDLRSVQRITRSVHLEPILPCAQFIVGDETVNTEEEDTQGFSVSIPASALPALLSVAPPKN